MGGTDAAGIGSGKGYACGTISITGGTITATGDTKAAGMTETLPLSLDPHKMPII